MAANAVAAQLAAVSAVAGERQRIINNGRSWLWPSASMCSWRWPAVSFNQSAI